MDGDSSRGQGQGHSRGFDFLFFKDGIPSREKMIGRVGGVRGGDAVGESGRIGTMRVVWRVAAPITIPRFRRCSLDLTLLGRVFLLFCLLHLWPLVVV